MFEGAIRIVFPSLLANFICGWIFLTGCSGWCRMISGLTLTGWTSLPPMTMWWPSEPTVTTWWLEKQPLSSTSIGSSIVIPLRNKQNVFITTEIFNLASCIRNLKERKASFTFFYLNVLLLPKLRWLIHFEYMPQNTVELTKSLML